MGINLGIEGLESRAPRLRFSLDIPFSGEVGAADVAGAVKKSELLKEAVSVVLAHKAAEADERDAERKHRALERSAVITNGFSPTNSDQRRKRGRGWREFRTK